MFKYTTAFTNVHKWLIIKKRFICYYLFFPIFNNRNIQEATMIYANLDKLLLRKWKKQLFNKMNI